MKKLMSLCVATVLLMAAKPVFSNTLTIYNYKNCQFGITFLLSSGDSVVSAVGANPVATITLGAGVDVVGAVFYSSGTTVPLFTVGLSSLYPSFGSGVIAYCPGVVSMCTWAQISATDDAILSIF